jgi:vacuolar-type H+-ATPase subunit E/Vma4
LNAAILGDPDALVAEISRRARQRAVSLEAEAQHQISTILDQAQKDCESIRAQEERETAAALESIAQRSKAQGELGARREFTLRREALLDRVWAGAEERLRNLTRESQPYLEILKQLALRGARELGGAEILLAADPVGHPLLTPDRLKEWSAEVHVEFRRAGQAAQTWGGLLATRGRTRFNASFPHQLAAARDSLRERVFQILTEEEP